MHMNEIQKIAKAEASIVIRKLREVHKLNFSDIGLFADSFRYEIKKMRR